MSPPSLSAEDFRRLAVEAGYKPFMGTMLFDTIFRSREGINRHLRKRRLPTLRTVGFMVGGRIGLGGLKSLATQDDILLSTYWMGEKSIQVFRKICAQL